MSQYRTVIFDFDGTLHDAAHIYFLSFLEAYEWLCKEGYRQPREWQQQDIAGYIGLTADEMWSSFAPDLSKDVTDRAAKIVGAAMDRMMTDGTARMFPGIPEMLQEVVDAGLEPVFLSNCRTAYQEFARAAFGLDRWFSSYYNAEAFGGIPKEQIFDTIKQEHQGDYIVVGDRYKDLNIARAHNLPAVGCLYGCGAPEELEDAWVCCKTADQVAKAIVGIAKGEIVKLR